MSTIVGDDGQPIVDARGVDLRLTESWREILRHVDEETVIWARSFRKMYGTKSDMAEAYVEDEEGAEDDPYADLDDGESERVSVSERKDEDVIH